MAIGQPTGYITLIDLKTRSVISEFRAFNYSPRKIVLTKKYIICGGHEFDYHGICISSKLPNTNGNGEPIYIDEKNLKKADLNFRFGSDTKYYWYRESISTEYRV